MSHNEVEYLESVGYQYIDTGVISTNNINYDIEYMMLDGVRAGYQCLIGSTNYHNAFYPYCDSKYNYIAYCYNSVEFKTLSINLKNIKCKLKKINNVFELSYNDTNTIMTASNSNSFNTNDTLLLFAMSTSYPDFIYARIYSCKIYDGEELIRDFIPVLDNNNIPCFYDNITQTYFYNQGKGTFVTNKSLYMPIITNVNAYFDARIGTGNDLWKNQLGDIDFQLYNPIINSEGIEIIGNNTSYGKFSKSWTSGSSRTWYFIFKNISGKYANWKTIIGNEISTYKCSTISMDGNGYIKFTRPDIVPSTSLGFKCSDWHVVAWVSNGSNSTTKMWIDGTYVGSVGNMQGWADDTYLGRGSSWWYEDNNTMFRAAAIADSAHSDEEIIANSKWLYRNYISEYTPLQFSFKYLIQDKDNKIYTIVNNNLIELENEILNIELFQNSGIDIIPEWDIIKTLINPRILLWCSESISNSILQLTAQMKAITSPQVLITNKIDLNDTNDIIGINQVTLDSDGDILITVSFDEKNSWLIFNGTNWNITSSNLEGMNKTTLEAITSEQWAAALGSSKIIYFKAIFSNINDILRKINIEFLKS